MSTYPSLESIRGAIVTGGSSGIGATFIRTLRGLEKLEYIGNLSRSEPDRFSQDTRCQHYPCDLSRPEQLEEAAGRVEKDVTSRSRGPLLLINNSGFGSYQRADVLPPATELAMIDLNVRALVDLTLRFLPLLLERGGWVVNVASLAAFQPTPFMATYGATKSFVLHWSLALRQDLHGRGVGVLAVCPGPTESNFFRRAGFTAPPQATRGQSAEAVVAESLRALQRGRSLVVTGWKNRLLAAGSGLLPRRWQAPVARHVLQRFRLDQLTSQSSAR